MPETLNVRLLASVLGRLGSDHDGEVLSAARQAEKMVRAAGASWADVLTKPSALAPQADAPIPYRGRAVHPPHEGNWVATTLFLHRQAADPRSAMGANDRRWLLERAATWRRRKPYPHEAVRLAVIYREIVYPAGSAA